MSRMFQALKQLGANVAPVPLADGLPTSAVTEPFALGPAAGSSTVEPVQPGDQPPPPAEAEPKPPPREPLPETVDERDRQYFQMAENILAPLNRGQPAALVFAAPDDAEDKSGMLARLAAALTQHVSGEILVADCNFHNPTLAHHLGLQVRRSLVDVLLGTAHWREAVRQTKLERLYVLPGGRFPTGDGQPPEGLQLDSLIDQWRHEFRLVLLDTASPAHPEVTRLARSCDGTYLVIQLHRTPRSAARQAIRRLEQSGGQVLGCVLTDGPIAPAAASGW